MKTVKEVSLLTGISVRTLHYYDEIGLLKPTAVSEAGYRLYDDKALQVLQQILFFREFDMPLKEIKAIMENPALDQEQLLRSQRQMLVWKKERLERIIASMDEILKGDNRMDFKVFDKNDIEKLYAAMVNSMTEEQKSIIMKEYGSMEQYEKHFLESASGEKAQKNYAKVVEWYGDKDAAISAGTNPENPGIMEACAKRYEAAFKKLAGKKGRDVNSFEVKEVVGEIDFLSRQMYQMKDTSALMLDMADMYLKNQEIQKAQDKAYGEGATAFMGQAILAFYRK